jgi:hypothetical protein
MMTREQQPREADVLMPGRSVAKVPSARTANLPRGSGIYQIHCIPTGKIYIGSAVDLSGPSGKTMRQLV